MSKTPRTDAYMSRAFAGTYNEFSDLADFARQLEAENAELREALKSTIEILGHPDDSFTQYARALLAKETK